MVKVEFTDEYQKILWQISLFKDMDVSLQRRLPLELELSVYEVARKEVVLKQDTYCNHLYILLKGELEVNIVDVAGNLVKVEDIRAPRAFATPHLFGDVLGWDAKDDIQPQNFLLLGRQLPHGPADGYSATRLGRSSASCEKMMSSQSSSSYSFRLSGIW